MMILRQWAVMLAALCGVAALPCQAAPGAMESVDQAVCRTIERSAQAAHLPVDFVTRVIWRESSFRAGVVSRAGAEGIAQLHVYGAHEHPLTEYENGERGTRVGGQWMPPL